MFGRSKKKQAPEQMQISADALALLQAMQANQQMPQQPVMPPQMSQEQMMQQQAMQQQAMQQQMMQQQQAMQQQAMQQQMMQEQYAQQQMMQQQMMQQQMQEQAALEQPQQPSLPAQPSAAMEAAPAAPQAMATPPAGAAGFGAQIGTPEPTAPEGKLTKEQKKAKKQAEKERKKAEKADKKANKDNIAKEKKEEKLRAKRRKKLAKTRFSRARYLREANGNAVAGVVLWVFMIIAFIIGPIMLNLAFLIPQTNENLRIIREVDGLKRSIEQNQPQISAMLEKRKQKEGQIQSFTTSFIPSATAQTQLDGFVTQLEEAGLVVTQSNLGTAGLAATSITGVAGTVTVEGSYLNWLRVRNKFVRTQRAISIPNESVKVSEEGQAMVISAQIIIPAAK